MGDWSPEGVEALAGLIEIRGIGLVRQAAEPAVVVRLIVDLSADEPGAPARSGRTGTRPSAASCCRAFAHEAAHDLIDIVLRDRAWWPLHRGHDRVMKFLSQPHLRSASQCTK